MQTCLSSSFFYSAIASLLSLLLSFPRIRGALLLSLSLSLSLFLSSPPMRLSQARTRTRRAERESNSKSAGGNRADWPPANHVGDPTDSRLCSRLAAFRTPVFAADYARAPCVPCVHASALACMRARSLARSFPRTTFSPSRSRLRLCVRIFLARTSARRICRDLLGVFWRTATSFRSTCIFDPYGEPRTPTIIIVDNRRVYPSLLRIIVSSLHNLASDVSSFRDPVQNFFQRSKLILHSSRISTFRSTRVE